MYHIIAKKINAKIILSLNTNISIKMLQNINFKSPSSSLSLIVSNEKARWALKVSGDLSVIRVHLFVSLFLIK